MKLAVALSRPRSDIGTAPATPSTSAPSNGVPDMTLDSARNATPRRRARLASSTPRKATGHLFEVTTGIARSSASRMCAKPGSPSADGLAATSTRRSASVARSPSSALGQRCTPGSSAIDLPLEASPSTEGRSSPSWWWTNPSRALARPTTTTPTPYWAASRSACESRTWTSHRPTVPKPTSQIRSGFTLPIYSSPLLGHELGELVERVRPAVAVQRASRFGLERALA